MDPDLKFCMVFKDRVGVVADISAAMSTRNFNIASMEVERTEDKAKIYLEVEEKVPAVERREILEILGGIRDLLEIRLVETLPKEMRENRFRVILDNISDGVVSIDTDGKITAVNKIASRALNCGIDGAIGKDVMELQLPDYAILECLKGKKFNHVKKEIITETGRLQYFSTCRPIIDSKDRIVGAVEIGKDMREIKMLAKSISQARPTTFTDFIGQNPVIRESITFAQKIAKMDSIVSIRGESGTGKEVFARAIHTASGRSGPFIPVNCAALPETLLESELFGYVGGAFTGAKKEGKPGLFELASSGTIFLDEISDMPFSVQAKILRVIQEKCVRSIGGSKENPIDCRVLTSTNENLEQMVKDKLFREDLYYRISVLPIHIPPLRERIDDIPLLVEHFLFQLDCKLDRTPQTVTEDAMEKLCRYNWPGNVRELKNVIERAAILCESDRIDADCILFNFEIGKGSGELRSHFLCPEGRSLQAMLDHYEKQILRKTLEGSESIRKAAKSLSMSHTALLNKVKKHRIVMERK